MLDYVHIAGLIRNPLNNWRVHDKETMRIGAYRDAGKPLSGVEVDAMPARLGGKV
jgi:hypothetical protein